MRCRECGCTDADCSGCIEATGEPCWWVEPDLCSRCAPRKTERVPAVDVQALRRACMTAAEFTAAMRKATEAIESSATTATAAIRRFAELYAKHNRRHGQVVTMSDGVTRWVPR